MPGFERITRCLELSDADIDKAVASRAETKELIRRLTSIAKPNDGAPKILLLFARLALGNSDWMDGYLHIEITGDEQSSSIEAMTELGAGMRERLLPAIPLNVPLSEFARALERVPHMIQPLYVHAITPARLILSAMPPASDSQDFGRPISVISTPVGSPSAQPAAMPLVAQVPVPDFATKPPAAQLKPEDSAPTRPFSPAVLLAEETAVKREGATSTPPAATSATPASGAPTKPMPRPPIVMPETLEPTRANKPAPGKPPILPPRLSKGGARSSTPPATNHEAATKPLGIPRPASGQPSSAPEPSRPVREAASLSPFSTPTVPRMTAAKLPMGAPSPLGGHEPPSPARGDGINSRPTVPPPFDMTEFARKRTGPAPNVRLPDLPSPQPPTLDPRLAAGPHPTEPQQLSEDMLLRRIGSLERVPRIVGGTAEISALSRDRATAFLLSQIDGVSTLEMIVDVSGMPRIEALRILFGLIERRTIVVD